MYRIFWGVSLVLSLLALVVTAIGGGLYFTARTADEREMTRPVANELPEVMGIPGARYWADVAPHNLEDLKRKIADQRAAAGIARVTALALSGGADDGAYGAGVLTAWSETGDRPEFTIVTGVSTGAITAPFAFLGRKWNTELKTIFGGIPTDQIYRTQNPFNMLRDVSLVNTDPLEEQITRYTNKAFLDAIAKEHRRGRRLYVQSTHLDAQRPVLWDLGAIAASGAPNAVEVFRRAIFSSAAVPGVFNPVIFGEQLLSGERDEMHVDGGIISQITLVRGWQRDLHRISRPVGGPTHVDEVYVILNARLAAKPVVTKSDLFSVAERSIATMIMTQYSDDLRIARGMFRRYGIAFSATWIDENFAVEKKAPFDPKYMKLLFDYGYNKALTRKVWEFTSRD